MSVRDQIETNLRAAFAVTALEVVDDSESHRGHAGYQDGGESHFNVVIAAPELTPLSRIARHRAVHAAIGPDLVARIHALSIDIQV